MTRENAKNLLPIIRAYSEGKTVQVNCNHGSDAEVWRDCDEPEFDDDASCYRIKPETKLRPWKQSDVLPLIGTAVMRIKRVEGNTDLGLVGLITGASRTHVHFTCGSFRYSLEYSFDTALEQCEWSALGEMDFKPCGVEETSC